MLYYRTKRSANNKPMYRGKGRKANEEAWSIYIADELFTEKEVVRMNLNRDYLELVEIQKNQTHRQGCFRVANFDANIKLVKTESKPEPLSKDAQKELISRLKDRRSYKHHLSTDSSVRPTTILVRFKLPTQKKNNNANPIGAQVAQS